MKLMLAFVTLSEQVAAFMLQLHKLACLTFKSAMCMVLIMHLTYVIEFRVICMHEEPICGAH